MIARNSFWKPSRPAGIENIGKVIPRIDIYIQLFGFLFDEVFEEVNFLTLFNDTFRNFIEKEANRTFPNRKEIDEVCNNGPF